MSDAAELTYRTPEKSIGGLLVNAYTLEEHMYTSTASEYPIDSEAPISDNIRLAPEELKIEGIIEAGVISDQTGAQSAIVSVFDELLALRKARTAVSVTTGLKIYTDMYIADFSVPRKARDGGSLVFSMRLKSLNIVYLTEVGIPSGQLGGTEADKQQAAGELNKGSVSGNNGDAGTNDESFLDKVQESVDNFVGRFE